MVSSTSKSVTRALNVAFRLMTVAGSKRPTDLRVEVLNTAFRGHLMLCKFANQVCTILGKNVINLKKNIIY